jgi:replicative DNA helicase
MFDMFLADFKQGMSGNNTGIPLGLPRIESFLNGMHRKRYYTVFAEGGVGKTSFVWSTFVIGPLDYMLKHNKAIEEDPKLTAEQKEKKKLTIRVVLFSLEVVKAEVIAKMVCLKIYRDYGLVIDVDYILNRVKNYRLHPALAFLVQSYKTYFDMLERQGYLEIYDSPHTPSDIARRMRKKAEELGTFGENKKGEVTYTPHNRREIVIPITDTVGNLTIENINGKTSTKATIDAHSSNCRYLYRDLYYWIPINISHSNRAMSDPNRARSGEVFPKLSDIKETNMLEQDSSVVLTLFNPMNHITTVKKLEHFLGYNIPAMGERFRCLGILKNRHGDVNKLVGLKYIGENAHFEEIPVPQIITAEDYSIIRNIKHAKFIKHDAIVKIIKTKNPKFAVPLDKYLEKVKKKKAA